jgi:hypothetical protein
VRAHLLHWNHLKALEASSASYIPNVPVVLPRARLRRIAKSPQSPRNKAMVITWLINPAIMTRTPWSLPRLSFAVAANAPPMACKTKARRSQPTKMYVYNLGWRRE